MQGLTPMMQQYMKVKEKHKDHIVFFRLGDFYEMFFEDAKLASKELELTLTGRDCGLEERAPMCGIPYHSADNYIARLIRKGYKVAVCEQMEDPAAAKGIVVRDVVRVITPGTLVENDLLDEEKNNYLCCINLQPNGCGMVFADISTGVVQVIELSQRDDSALINELARYTPKEVIVNQEVVEQEVIVRFLQDRLCCSADLLEEENFDLNYAKGKVEHQFSSDVLQTVYFTNMPCSLGAMGALLTYLESTQKTGLERLITIQVVEETRYMNVDLNARANLELLQTQRTHEKKGSLLWVLDHTKTPMGKRLLRSYLSQPLVNPTEINKRLNAVEELYKSELLALDLVAALKGMFDVERLMTRVVYGNASPREYKALEQGVEKFPQIKDLLRESQSEYLRKIYEEIDKLEDLKHLLQTALLDDPAPNLKEGGVIREGYSAELDEMRNLISHSKEYMTKLEQKEKESTGIKNLKIGFNRVFGYYFEVTKSYQNLVPEHYIRKQTLANCERYITQELKELEEKIMHANEEIVALETRLFEEVRSGTIQVLDRLQKTSLAIAQLDVFLSFARVSLANQYVRPDVTLSGALRVEEGRHPVVEQMLEGAPFVPNNLLLDDKDNQIAVITGPNMAGKSTYMRQNALIVIMAQIGCFVPAKRAEIGIVDGIYTRIGASDDLSSGQSTFMVEMVEVADILRKATAKSLLLLDEIGRGTSTYDGMSIARSVIEYIADGKKLGARTLFATHYHELTVMENVVPGVKNYNIAAKKRGDDIIFLRRIVRGGADDSYGIEVSKLAGVPEWVVQRAYEVLESLESMQPTVVEQAPAPLREPTEQITFSEVQKSDVEKMLETIDVNTLTPIEAMTILYQLKEKMK